MEVPQHTFPSPLNSRIIYYYYYYYYYNSTDYSDAALKLQGHFTYQIDTKNPPGTHIPHPRAADYIKVCARRRSHLAGIDLHHVEDAFFTARSHCGPRWSHEQPRERNAQHCAVGCDQPFYLAKHLRRFLAICKYTSAIKVTRN